MKTNDLLSALPTEDSLPKENQTWTAYRDYLQGIRKDANFFERGKGWISWLQGEVLNRCVTSKKLKRGEYSQLLKSIGMQKGTAYNCRRIAANFPPEVARVKGFSEMLRVLKWETLDKRHDLERDAPELDDTGPTGSSSQIINPNKGRPKSVKSLAINYENHKSKFSSLVDLATAASKFQVDPPVELADAEKYYDAIRTEADKARRLIAKTIKRAEKEIETLRLRIPKKTKRTKKTAKKAG